MHRSLIKATRRLAYYVRTRTNRRSRLGVSMTNDLNRTSNTAMEFQLAAETGEPAVYPATLRCPIQGFCITFCRTIPVSLPVTIEPYHRLAYGQPLELTNLWTTRPSGVISWVGQHELFNRNSPHHLKYHRYGHISSSALKLYDIIDVTKLSLNLPGRALDLCGGPGGFSEVLLSLGFNTVHGVTCSSIIRYDPSVALTSSYDFDITNRDAALNFIKHHRNQYDLVVADGAVGAIYTEPSAEHQQTLEMAEIQIAMSTLKKGGDLVIKTFWSATPSNIVPVLFHAFSRVRLLKPLCSRPTNNEFYIICTGFRRHITASTAPMNYDYNNYVTSLSQYYVTAFHLPPARSQPPIVDVIRRMRPANWVTKASNLRGERRDSALPGPR